MSNYRISGAFACLAGACPVLEGGSRGGLCVFSFFFSCLPGCWQGYAYSSALIVLRLRDKVSEERVVLALMAFLVLSPSSRCLILTSLEDQLCGFLREILC